MKRVAIVLWFLILCVRVQAQTITPAGPITLCPGGSVVLSISGTTNTDEIKWKKDGNDLSNATASTLTVTASGKYTASINNVLQNEVTVTVLPVYTPILRSNNEKTVNGQVRFAACSSSAVTYQFWTEQASDPSITKYVINWGDGSPNEETATPWTTSNKISHTYSVGQKTLRYSVFRGSCESYKDYIVVIGSVPAGGITGVGGSTLCTGGAQEFIISGTENNSPTTIYEITFNDGSTKETYTHPVPSSIQHAFTKSSCGTFSGTGLQTYTNAFGAYLSIINECGSASGSIVPIYVSDKPEAKFTLDQYACEGQTKTVMNIGVYGNDVSNGNCVTGKLVWVIRGQTPGTTWTVTSGSLGVKDNSGNPNNWTSGTNTFDVKFLTPGTYTITEYMANSSLCGQDTLMKTIYVNPIPLPTLVIDQSSGCGPLTVNATGGTSNSPHFGNNTYSYTVTYTATTGCSPNTSLYSYTGNTTSTSQNPQFLFANPGIYTIQLIVTAPGGSCTSQPITKQITVKGKPIVSLQNIPNYICEGGTISPTALVTCYTSGNTYAWNFTGGTPTSSTSPTPGSISYNSAGSYTIQVGVTNECGVTNASGTITVRPKPQITQPANIVVCNGQPVNLIQFTSSLTGSTINWINSNTSIGVAASGYGYIPSFTAVNTGSTPVVATISVSATKDGCTGSNQTMTITVNPSPVVGVNSESICNGSSVTLTASGADTYSWAPSTGLSATTGTSVSANPTSTTNYIVEGKSTATGCTATATSTVTVKPVPSIVGSSSNPTACSSSTGYIELNGLASGTYVVSFKKNGVQQTNQNLSASAGKITIPNLGAGEYTNVSVSLNGCTSNEVGPFTLVDPTPPNAAQVTVAGPVCAGGTLEFTVLNRINGATYKWTGPNGFSRNTTSDVLQVTNAPVAAGGVYTVVVDVASCTSSPTFITGVVNPNPNVTVNSGFVCTGSSIELKANGADSYSWSAVPGLNQYTGATVIATPATNSNYLVTGTTTATGCTTTVTASVDVRPIPNITGSYTDPTLCGALDGTIKISGLAINTAYTVTYYKNGVLQTVNKQSSNTGLITVGSLNAAIYSDISVGLNGCTSNKIGPYELKDPNPPADPQVVSNSPICSGNAISISVTNPVSGASYQWSGPSGFSSTITSSTLTINNAVVNQSGTYSVTTISNNCPSGPTSIAVIVNPTPTAPGVSPLAYCQNATAAPLTAIANSGNSLVWYTTATGGSGSSTPPTPSTTSVGTVRFYVSQKTPEGCEGPRAQLQVTIYSTPSVPDQTFAVCTGVNFSLTPPAQPNGMIYTWGAPVVTGGMTGASAGTGGSITGNLVNTTNQPQTATYTVFTRLGSCDGNSFTLTLTVNPAARIPNRTAEICSKESFSVTPQSGDPGVVLPNGTVYTWTAPVSNPLNTITGGTAQAVGQNSIGQLLANRSNQTAWITYTVTPKVSSTNCVGAPFDIVVTVHPKPEITKKTVVICSGGTFTVRPTNNEPTEIVPGNTTYTWSTPISSPAGAITGGTSQSIPQAEISQTLVNTTTASAVLTYTVTPISGATGSCVGEPFLIEVTVQPIPSITNKTTTICHGTAFTVSPANVPINTTYTWSNPVSSPAGVITGGSAQFIPQVLIKQTLYNNTNLPADLIYTVTPSAGGCSNNSFTITVTVNPAPQIPDQQLEICNGKTFTIEPAHVPPTTILPLGTTYTWSLPVSVPAGAITGGAASVAAQSKISQVLFNDTDAPGVLTYTVTPISGAAGTCSGLPFKIAVTVDPDVKAKINVKRYVDCYPFLIEKTNVENTTATTSKGSYKWYVNNVLVGTAYDFPGYTITNPYDSVLIKLVVTSTAGCKADSIQKKFYSRRKPDASFLLSAYDGCGPLYITPDNRSTFDTSFTYAWNFGNGVLSNKYQPGVITFNTNPVYTDTTYLVKLAVYNECERFEASKTVKVSSKPLARFTPSKTFGCSPMTVSFNNTSMGSVSSYVWDFGDGSRRIMTTKDSVQHTYFTSTRDTVIVKLIAINSCGSDTSVFNLILSPNTIKLDVAVNGLEQNGCGPHTVRFINNTQGAGQFLWDFGDGNIQSTIKNRDTVVHIFENPGTYIVHVFASNNCSDTSITETIKVFSKPIPNFDVSSFVTCIGDSLTFTNKSSNADSYRWTLGNGATSSAVNVRYKYDLSGLYTVTLTAIKTYSVGLVCTDSIKKQIRILDSTATDFNMSNAIGYCAPFKVDFSTSFSNASRIEWDFGDGTRAFGNAVSHLYMARGVYYPKLTIIANGGCIYFAQKKVEVKSPVGTVKIDTGYVCGSRSVRFESFPVDADSTIWDFGDGIKLTTAERIIYHSYAFPGTYNAVATFKSISGCTYIDPSVNVLRVDRMIAGFKQAAVEDCGKTTLTVTDTSNVFFGKASVRWIFGNGKVGTGFTSQTSYDLSNAYYVEEIVTGVSGCSDTIRKPVPIFVRSQPDAEVQISGPVCTGKAVTFNAYIQSTDSITAYTWVLSNGIRSQATSFSATFPQVGTYGLQFITATKYGCYDTVNTTFKVNPTPIVTAVPDVYICKGSSVQLGATGAEQYVWYPIEGLDCIQCQNPIAKPLINTPYTVKGSTAAGCFAYDTVVVKVIQPFKIKVSPGDSICIGQSYLLLASGAASFQWTPSATLNRSDISNPIATPTASTVYRVVGFDEYDCFTDTGYVTVGVGRYPAIDLGPDTTLFTGTLLPLNPSVLNGPIKTWKWSPATDLTCSNCANPVAYIRKDITYIVSGTNYFGCSGSDTIHIKAICKDVQVFIPNAFSPDGDGINDVFMVRGTGIMQVKSIRIFSRWGDVVFEKLNVVPNDPSFGWDGRVNGVVKGPDVFAYIVEVVCDNGTPYFFKGNVTLLK